MTGRPTCTRPIRLASITNRPCISGSEGKRSSSSASRLNELVHYPLTGSPFAWVWVLNLAVWLGAFVLGAVWQFRRDTARV